MVWTRRWGPGPCTSCFRRRRTAPRSWSRRCCPGCGRRRWARRCRCRTCESKTCFWENIFKAILIVFLWVYRIFLLGFAYCSFTFTSFTHPFINIVQWVCREAITRIDSRIRTCPHPSIVVMTLKMNKITTLVIGKLTPIGGVSKFWSVSISWYKDSKVA